MRPFELLFVVRLHEFDLYLPKKIKLWKRAQLILNNKIGGRSFCYQEKGVFKLCKPEKRRIAPHPPHAN